MNSVHAVRNNFLATFTESNLVMVSKTTTPVIIKDQILDHPYALNKQESVTLQMMRQQLFGETDDAPTMSEEDERNAISSEMVGFAQDLKAQSQALNDRLRSDVEMLSQSQQLMEDNQISLHSVSNQLQEELGRSCGCIIWIVFLLTLCIFVNMVILMKMFRKPKYYGGLRDEL
ncbi:SNAP receptor use1 [Cichlidogyrus casuarinus]|uniref:Vesicle transport protein USE1 n=1 Tax=Cichlidogyrus casuarinus TaxID=1844966 RepID=A0ABD2QEM1_9PLAT